MHRKWPRFISLVLILVPTVVVAQLEHYLVTEASQEIQTTAVAISPVGEVYIAWDCDQYHWYTWSRFFRDGVFDDPWSFPYTHSPDLCWTESGFTLAATDDYCCSIWTGRTPDDYGSIAYFYEEYWESLDPSLSPVRVPGHEAEVLLCWQTSVYSLGVATTALVDGDWLPVSILDGMAGDPYEVNPQMLPLADGRYRCFTYHPWHEIWFHDGPFGQWMGGGLVGDYTWYSDGCYDTAMGPDFRHALLTVNATGDGIHFIEQITPEDPWINFTDLSVDLGYYNYPDTPCLEIGPDGTVNAFWHQTAEDENHQPVAEALCYFTRDPSGVWQDQSAILDGVTGDRISLALFNNGSPAFVYVTGEGSGSEVWLAFDPTTTVAPVTPATLRLSAAPNPFNPKTTLRFELPVAGLAELAIYDLTGRRVATLLREDREAGECSIDWSGRDDAGSHLASGVYLARATVPGYSAVEKLVMLK